MSTISAGNTVSTAITITGDTTGNLVFQTQAGTNTITLPNSTGTLALTGAAVVSSQLPAGTVLQVVQGTASNQDTTTGNTFVASSLSASITPKFSTSKILILVSSLCTNTGNGQGNYTIYRGGTNLGGGSAGQASLQMFFSSSGYQFVPLTMVYLDSPATTSATTYQVYFKTQSGNTTTYFGTGNITETITLMEIAA
jgi:hypothetical protein